MHHRKPIFLDIETIPGQHPSILADFLAQAEQEKAAIRLPEIKAPSNYKDEEKIAAYILDKQNEQAGWLTAKHADIYASVDEKYRKTSFDGALGQIVSISVAVGDEAPENFFREDWANSEAYLLGELNRFVADNYTSTMEARPVFVGHNVVGFDLRFIYQRSVLLGIQPNGIIPFNARPWDDIVFDTMVQWAGVGKTVSLDKLCRVFGIPTKGSEIGDEIDGSKVWDFVQAGRIADVAMYCGGDVDRVREIYRRMTFYYQQLAA